MWNLYRIYTETGSVIVYCTVRTRLQHKNTVQSSETPNSDTRDVKKQMYIMCMLLLYIIQCKLYLDHDVKNTSKNYTKRQRSG